MFIICLFLEGDKLERENFFVLFYPSKVLSVKDVMQTMGHQWLYTYGPQRCVPWKMNAEMADTSVTSPLRSVLIHQNPINVIAKKDTATLLELGR